MNTNSRNYAHKGLAGIGGLGKEAQSEIVENLQSVMSIINQAKQEKNYKYGDTLGFDEIDRLYNVGISKEEKIAWVWYKRSMGVPMKGWEKYFISKKNSFASDVLVTTRETKIMDNAFREIGTMPGGVTLGRATKFKNEYKGVNWLIFVAQDGGRRWVSEADVKKTKTGVSADESLLEDLVKNGALFYCDGQYLPYPIFAFGNMYDRELQIRQDESKIREKFGNEVYNTHRDIIQRAKPRMLSVQNPDINERPKILVISRFARDYAQFGITQLREDAGFDVQDAMAGSGRGKGRKLDYDSLEERRTENGEYRVSLSEAFNAWLDTLHKSNFVRVSANDIAYYYVNARQFSKNIEKEERALIEIYAPIEGEALFSRFLNEVLTFDDQQKLDFLWNRIFNGFASIPHYKVPIGFSCSALFKTNLLSFTKAQREAIAFMEVANAGIIAYDVGVGKTMSAIITLANAMQAGKCSRPLIVVPNPTYEKWIREIVGYTTQKGEIVSGVMTGLDIKINRFYNLGKKTATGIKLDREVAANSITVMTYEGFAQLGFSPKIMKEHFDTIADILNQDDDDTKSKRDGEKTKQGYAEMIGRVQKGTGADIDVLGFDYLIIDEAHNFKNVFANVPTDEEGRKRYSISGNTSDRAIKAFFHCNYIQRVYNGNVMLLTATPFTNSPLEIYSMLGLVGYQDMVKMGLNNLQTFMSTFVLQSLEYANNYNGTIVLKNVVKSYQNRLILQTLIHNKIAYKTGEEAGVKRPVKINIPRLNQMRNGKLVKLKKEDQILSYLEMNDLQREFQNRIVQTAQGTKKLGEIGRALGQSLDNALSPYLVEDKSNIAKISNEDYVNDSPKIKYAVECIRSVKKWHEERKQTCSGQVIYMNRGRDFFGHIKGYLESSVGFKRNVKFQGKTYDEVELITSGISNEAKEGIKDAFLSGVVKVLIGTATIREGIDLQTRGSVIYNLYPDWNPTDIRQLEGRIWRQGNDFGYVRVVMPLVQDTMDVFVFQKLEEKSSRINDIWFRSDRGNVLDQESLDPEEIKFSLFTDIGKLVGIRVDQEKQDITLRKNVVEGQWVTLGKIQASMTEYKYYKAEVLKGINRFITLINEFLNSSYPGESQYQAVRRKYYAASTRDEKWIKEFIAKLTEQLNELREFVNSNTQDDKETIRVGNQVEVMNRKVYGERYEFQKRTLDSYKSSFAILVKGEKTVLAPKGYSLNDNIDDIRNEVKAEFQKLVEDEKQVSSPENIARIREEVIIKKEALAVTGETPEVRAAEFAKYNYLLAYGADEVDVNADIPRNRGFALTMGEAASTNAQKIDASATDLARERKKKLLILKIKIAAAAAKLSMKAAA